MNCIEALAKKLQDCEPCKINSVIIEFSELPESERKRFESYNEKTDFILHCQKCQVYTLLPTKTDKEV